MTSFHQAALSLALLASPALSDVQLVRKTHTDAYTINGKQTAAKDSQTTLWLAKDKLRIDSDELPAIVRLDQKKLILLDPKEKTWTAIDLPFDPKKYVPPEMAGMIEQMLGAKALQAKVEARDETKVFGAWNARRYEITLSQAGNQVSKEIVWASKDVKLDAANFGEMYATLLAMDPANKNLVPELKKIEGFPVRSEQTQSRGGAEVKTTEELLSADEKEAAAGLYDPPAGYTEKPFDPKSFMPAGRRVPPGK